MPRRDFQRGDGGQFAQVFALLVAKMAYFIPGNQAPDIYFGLFAGQWVGTALLLFAILMLSRVNREETAAQSVSPMGSS